MARPWRNIRFSNIGIPLSLQRFKANDSKRRQRLNTPAGEQGRAQQMSRPGE
jgi:hypothetical protein